MEQKGLKRDLNQRIYSFLLILGGLVLLYRTIRMLSEGALDILMTWVFALLILELIIDLSCIVSSAIWFITNNRKDSSLPLKLGASAAILHAFRVLIFVLGRIGPWINFDVKPAMRATHGERWSWGGVYFAAILSLLGIIGVLIIWYIRRRRMKSEHQPNFH